MQSRKVLAIDFGASGGRAMIGTLQEGKISIEEIHRFSNDPVILRGTMYWDVLRLFHEIKQSLIKAKRHGKIDSIAVDTWGVDFGLLDKDGVLLENPVHYRDDRTHGMLEKSFTKINKSEFYEITGNQFMEINTAFQLLSMTENRKEVLARATDLLLMPDLFHYFLSGMKKAEISIASTTQLFDARKHVWSEKVLEKLGLRKEMFPEIVPTGTVIGELSKELCEELSMEPVKVVAAAGHDTQDALAATPAKEQDFIFLSCGTWSLLGTELDEPIINEMSRELNITNECGYGGKTSFLKNIIGLWLIQESRRQWAREGKEYSFGQLEEMAEKAEPFRCFIDPDDPVFVPAGDVPSRIREYCKRTGQAIPRSEAEIVRCIDESLALKYRLSLEEIKKCTGKEYETIYMIGGGTQSKLLCSMTASACGCTVSAGPVEATVLGNVAIQFIASGAIRDLAKARQIIRDSQEISYFKPQDESAWQDALERFRKILVDI